MRRNAMCLLAAVSLSIPLTGCGVFSKKSPPVQTSAIGPYEQYMPLTAATGDEAREYPSFGTTDAAETSYTGTPTWADGGSNASTTAFDPMRMPNDEPVALSGSRFHTVARRDTLFALARKYYGNQRRWKDIFEANRSAIHNPNQIFVGQRLAIP